MVQTFRKVRTLENRHSEDVRLHLLEYVELISRKEQSLAFGSKLSQPTYELLPLSKFPQDRLAHAVRISADRARRTWIDLRAAVRLCDLAFVITVEGYELAVLHRHPENERSKLRMNRWLDESGNRINRSNSEDRMARLERVVKDLQYRIGHDSQKS
jgi:hypothetical protein